MKKSTEAKSTEANTADLEIVLDKETINTFKVTDAIIRSNDARYQRGSLRKAKPAIPAVEEVKAVKAVKAQPAVAAVKAVKAKPAEVDAEGNVITPAVAAVKAVKAKPEVKEVKAVKAVKAKPAVPAQPASLVVTVFTNKLEHMKEIVARMMDQNVAPAADAKIEVHGKQFKVKYEVEDIKIFQAAFKAAKTTYNKAGLEIEAKQKKEDAAKEKAAAKAKKEAEKKAKKEADDKAAADPENIIKKGDPTLKDAKVVASAPGDWPEV